MMGFGFGFMGIFMILFWGLVIWTIFALVQCALGDKECCQGNCHAKRNDEALEILRNRYAKSEISKEEFEGMKKDLEK